MKPIVFDNEMTTHNIVSLMESIHDSISKEKIILYFSGHGINISGEKMLINFINNLDLNNVQIEIIAFNHLFESAFNVFFKCCPQKSILKTVIGMIRLPQDPAALKEIRVENRFLYDVAKKDNETFLKWISPVNFTEREARKIKSGKQLMLDNNRLMTILHGYYNILSEPV